jgi:predicted aconitase
MTTQEIGQLIELLHGTDMSKEEIALIMGCPVSSIEELDKQIMTFHSRVKFDKYREVIVKESKV